MEEARMKHEIYKSSIIGPCSAIALGMVCTLLYFLLKPRMGNAAPLNKKHDLKIKQETNMKMETTYVYQNQKYIWLKP